ncbi:TPA: MBL fold metallo-hydrolase [Klebsiella pneumoniae]|nr:MBL fold metallo-hydrolase [Klebsiella pneumoniae]
MPEIKLFMFQSGTQHCRYQHIRMNQGVGEHYEIPVPWFLLTHPDGFTLIDGGLAVEGLKDPSGYWGSAVEQFKPVMSEEQGCVEQLKRIGIAPEDIRYVVLSHLHSDHTGAIDRQKASVKQGCQLILFEMALVMAGAISAGKLRASRPARHD